MSIVSLGNNALRFNDSADSLSMKIEIMNIVAIANATGGNFALVNADGNTVWESGVMNANSRTESGELGWVRGLAFTSFPAGGEVIVYHE